jgi:hypothetical protein
MTSIQPNLNKLKIKGEDDSKTISDARASGLKYGSERKIGTDDVDDVLDYLVEASGNMEQPRAVATEQGESIGKYWGRRKYK